MNNAVINLFFDSEKAKRQIALFRSEFKTNMADIGTVASGILGNIPKAIGSVIDDFKKEMKQGIDIINMANYTDMSTQKLQLLQNQLMQMGITGERTSDAVNSLTKALDGIKSNEGVLMDVLSKAEIDVTGIDNGIDLLDRLRESLYGIESAGQRALLGKLGLSDEGFFRYVNLSKKELEQIKSFASEGLYTAETESQLTRLRDNMNKFKTRIKQASDSIINDMNPAFETTNNILDSINEKGAGFFKTILYGFEAIKIAGATVMTKIGFDFLKKMFKYGNLGEISANLFKGIFSKQGLVKLIPFVGRSLLFLLRNALFGISGVLSWYLVYGMGESIANVVDYFRTNKRKSNDAITKTGYYFDKKERLKWLKVNNPELYNQFKANEGVKPARELLQLPKQDYVGFDMEYEPEILPISGSEGAYDSLGQRFSSNTSKTNNMTFNIFAQSDKAVDIQNALSNAIWQNTNIIG